MAQNDEPVCRDCGTETIVALCGVHRCLDCGKVWDGSESADVFSGVVTADEASKNVVTDILRLMWRKGAIEPHIKGA